MLDWFYGLTTLQQATMGGIFIWGMTALGAATVIPMRNANERIMDGMLGFAGGVMLAASYFSLLGPAVEIAEAQGVIPSWIPACGGFLIGAGFVRLADAVLPHVHPRLAETKPEGPESSWHRTTLMITAIAIHNIPEGLAVGVAFGAAGADASTATVAGAMALAIGIGIQDIPEGAAISFPLRRAGMSTPRSFFWGQASGFLELISAVVGVLIVGVASATLPWTLSFAAGAMVFVVIEEVMPEAHGHGHSDTAAVATMFGFAVMMALDVGFG